MLTKLFLEKSDNYHNHIIRPCADLPLVITSRLVLYQAHHMVSLRHWACLPVGSFKNQHLGPCGRGRPPVPCVASPMQTTRGKKGQVG